MGPERKCPVKRVAGGNCEGGENREKCIMDQRYDQLKKSNLRSFIGNFFRRDDAQAVNEQCKGCLFHTEISQPFETYEAIKSGEREIEFDDDNTMMNPWTSTK